MRPKAFTADIEAAWRRDYADAGPPISEEQYFARRWLAQYCDSIGMCAAHTTAFVIVHSALCGQGGNCWNVTKGLISLVLKATAHKRG